MAFDRQVAALRCTVYRQVQQDCVHHGNHRHERLHELQASILCPVDHRDGDLRLRRQFHPRHSVFPGVDDVFHPGMRGDHFPCGMDQLFRADFRCRLCQVGTGIGFLAAAGQAFQVDPQLRLCQGVILQVQFRGRPLCRPLFLNKRRQFPGGGMRRNVLEGQRGLLVAQLADQHRRAQGGPAALEEVVRRAGPFHLQGFRERLADFRFQVRFRRFVFRLSRRNLHRFQRGKIHLVPVVSRQSFQVDAVFRHHVFRQGFADECFHRFRGGFLPRIVAADQVSAVHLYGDAHGLLDARIAGSRAPHLVQLDPVSADLDHVVLPPVEDQVAFAVPRHIVARVEQASARHARVFLKLCVCLQRQPLVSDRQVRAGDAQLPDLAGFRDNLAVLVLQVRGNPPAGFPQGIGFSFSQRVHQHGRALAGPVKFVDRGIFIRFLHPRLFAAQQDVFQRQRSVKLPHHAVHLGRQEHSRDLPFPEQRPDHIHVFPFRFVGDVDASPVVQGQRQVDHRSDKAESRDAQGPHVFREGKDAFHRVRIDVQDPLAVDDSLRLSRGSGSVEDQAFRVRVGKVRVQVSLWDVLAFRKKIFQEHAGGPGKVFFPVFCADAQFALDILHHRPHALRRVFPVHRHRGAARPENGQQDDRILLCPGQQDGNPFFAFLCVGRLEDSLCQISRPFVHLLIGIRALDIHHGNPVRILLRLLQEFGDNGSHASSPLSVRVVLNDSRVILNDPRVILNVVKDLSFVSS